MTGGGVSQPPDPQAPAIPYSGDHDGQPRILQLRLRKWGFVQTQPTVGIDGREYVGSWGLMTFEVPADRATHVSVFLPTKNRTGAAATLLLADQAPNLEYSAPAHPAMAGEIGPPNTTVSRGKPIIFVLLVLILLALIAMLAVLRLMG